MFAQLKRVRDVLASVKVVTTDPETVRALVEAIEELDDAMVMWMRAETFARVNREAAPVETFTPKSFDMIGFANDLLASAPTFHMGVVS